MAVGRENLQEAQRKSDETESKSDEETKEETRDLSRDQRNRVKKLNLNLLCEKDDEDIHGPMNSQTHRSIDIGSIRSSDNSKEKMKGKGKSSKNFIGAPGDCQYYLKTGRCGFGKLCRCNHPLEPLDKTRMPICKFFRRGSCSNRICRFQHIKPELVQKTEPESSRSRPKKREIRGVENLKQQNKRQRTEAQHNVQENQALGGGAQDNLQAMPETQNVHAHQDQPKLEGKKERNIQRERMEARQRLEQMKPTVEFNDLGGLRKTIETFGYKIQKGDGL